MRIQHNIMAMSAYRNYTNNVSAMQKNLEKLSSGYKINRAGDDAAGLAISEKMRAQISGLEAAQKNAKDGISLVQTAEGALTEVHDMLNRMVTLATQSANGTYADDTDRTQLQKEVNQLISEINRIADSSNFNGIQLLDGSMENGAITGATYNKALSSEDIQGLFGPSADPTQANVLAGKTILETDGESKQAPSFAINMEQLHITGEAGINLKVGNTELKTVQLNGDMTSADVAKAIASGIADEDGKVEIKVSDDKKVQFKVEAKGNQVVFTGTEEIAFDPSGKINYSVAEPDGTDPMVTGGGTTKINTYVASADNPISLNAVKISATPIGRDKDIDNLSIGISDYDNKPGNDISEGELLELAKKFNASGDVTLKVEALEDSDGNTLRSVSLYIGNTKVAATDDSFDLGTKGITDAGKKAVFYEVGSSGFGDSNNDAIGTLLIGSSSTTETVKADELVNMEFDLGMSIEPATDNSVSASVSTTKLGENDEGEAITQKGNLTALLKEKNLDNESVGDVKLTYGTDGKWKLSADDGEGTVTDLGEVKVVQDGGKWVVSKTADSTAAADQLMTLTPSSNAVLIEDVQRAYSGDGQKVASLGASDGKIEGTLNGAVQDIKPGSSGASSQLANATLDLSKYLGQDGNKITLGDTTYTVALGADSKFKDAANVIDLTKLTGKETDFAKKAAVALTAAAADNKTFSVGHDAAGKTTLQQLVDVKDSTDMTDLAKFASYVGIQTIDAKSLSNVSTAKGLTLQIGDTAASYNQLNVDIKDMHAASLGLEGLDISTQEGAQAAMDKIKAAINTVSDVRGTLGATQNRLDHTINNLSVMTENIQDAESTIRDVDVAEEMMAYTKNSILIQSAQAMLAQANQVPQGVLQLLG